MWVRFVGDPCGYRVSAEDVPPDVYPRGWVAAEIGNTGIKTRINLAQAYSVAAENQYQ